MSGQAWTQETICPELQIIWPDLKPTIQAESPPSLPAHMRREWLGFSPGLTTQGPGGLVRIVFFLAEWEEVTARPHQQMARWLKNVRALPRLDQRDSR